MHTIKNRNGVDLMEAEDIKKRWQEYTEELFKKDLHDTDNHDGVITHLEPDILECEVKWALGSTTTNKTSGGDGIPAELFQILKDNAVKVLRSICQQIWKTQQWPQDWKRSVFAPIPRKWGVKVTQLSLTLCDPSQNTGVGSLSLLQGIFPTQESNQGLLLCRQILYQLSYHGIFRKAMPKNPPTAVQLCSFHMLARLRSKSFKLGFSSI